MRLSLYQRERDLQHYILEHVPYRMQKYDAFNYSMLKKCNTVYSRRGGHTHYVNEVIIMGDTETSKDPEHCGDIWENHLVAWTVSIRAAGENICTLYGSDPESHIETLENIHNSMHGDRTVVYYHNLSYDWVFLRRFFLDRFGIPSRQLNTKPHYPILIEFENGIILKDSLILAQRKLERWANDLDVPDKKAVNAWDYNKIRHQGGDFTQSELKYIEHDTLAGVECLDAFRQTLKKNVATMPYTATGIVREEMRKTSKKRENRGREWFNQNALDYDYVAFSEAVYHGGYTHQNRFMKNRVIDMVYTDGLQIQCMDLASSYPWALISEMYPGEKFTPYPDCKPDVILKAMENYAFMFTACFYDIRLKDPAFPMPYLQEYKTNQAINVICDNGRILAGDYVEIPITEIDLEILAQYYTWNEQYTICQNVIFSAKKYLPKWFTDFVYNLFVEKTQLKDGDPVLYALAKSRLNSCYGMCCQHVLSNDIKEDYNTGEYSTFIDQSEEAYNKYLDNKNTFLPYQMGIWCTAYACRNLFKLGACVSSDGEWIYSDTDSCFAYKWDAEKLEEYNNERKQKLIKRGYDGVEKNDRIYWLGIAELDKVCTEFKGIHSKCYAYRDAETGILKITVAGVPKTGNKCLNDDINNFKPGFVFRGDETGKLTHTYIMNEIHKNKYGDIIGDSIDLSPCDYVVNDINSFEKTASFDDLFSEDVMIEHVYG